MKYALIDTATGTVLNVIEANESYAPPAGQSIALAQPTTEVGGNWNGSIFSPAPPYVPTPLELEMTDADLNLRQSFNALRQWADDAEVVAAQGATVSQAQLKAVIGRVGKLCDGLADLLVILNRR